MVGRPESGIKSVSLTTSDREIARNWWMAHLMTFHVPPRFDRSHIVAAENVASSLCKHSVVFLLRLPLLRGSRRTIIIDYTCCKTLINYFLAGANEKRAVQHFLSRSTDSKAFLRAEPFSNRHEVIISGKWIYRDSVFPPNFFCAICYRFFFVGRNKFWVNSMLRLDVLSVECVDGLVDEPPTKLFVPMIYEKLLHLFRYLQAIKPKCFVYSMIRVSNHHRRS